MHQEIRVTNSRRPVVLALNIRRGSPDKARKIVSVSVTILTKRFKSFSSCHLFGKDTYVFLNSFSCQQRTCTRTRRQGTVSFR